MKKKKNGFTLIEMVIVLALTVIILEIASSMLITGNKIFSDSDVRSTLQIEANNIQAELEGVGLQGKKITDIELNGDNGINGNNKTPYIDKKYSDLLINMKEMKIEKMKIEIEAYDKNSEYSSNGSISNLNPYEIIFDKVTGVLSVESRTGTKTLSSHVYSLNIVPKDTEDRFANTSSIEFNIILYKQKGSTDIKYPVSVKTTFRNK